MTKRDPKPPPTVDSVWRERRREYAGRTVRVVAVNATHATVLTLTNHAGQRSKPRKPTEVNLGSWHTWFRPDDAPGAPGAS